MAKRKVVLLKGGFREQAGVFVDAGGERIPLDQFLETHTPIQVGGAAAIDETAVAFMIVEELSSKPVRATWGSKPGRAI